MKIWGAVIVILGCGGTGFYMTCLWRREEKLLKDLGRMLRTMASELQYRMTPLPQLCRLGAAQCSGMLGSLMGAVALELEQQQYADVYGCVRAVLKKHPEIPEKPREILKNLGLSLGKFDVEGQLKALNAGEQECCDLLGAMAFHREEHLRSVQTLGLCAGAALAILFL